MSTHQEIADTLARIQVEIRQGQEQVARGRDADIARVRERCGAIGHAFVAPREFLAVWGSPRTCAVCGSPEKVA